MSYIPLFHTLYTLYNFITLYTVCWYISHYIQPSLPNGKKLMEYYDGPINEIIQEAQYTQQNSKRVYVHLI